MAGYGRFRARRSVRSRGRMRRNSRSRGSSGGKRMFRPRFATVGFNRDVEKKYWDASMAGSTAEVDSGETNLAFDNGKSYMSGPWYEYKFGSTVSTPAVRASDMLKGLQQGTTAVTRVGNKITVKYIKGAITFTAPLVNLARLKEQGGEGMISDPTTGLDMGYVRSTWRMCIVRDNQVNSADATINWLDVFEHQTGVLSGLAGVHSELKISSMGRFTILEDKTFELSAINPQKTIPFWISGSKVGSVRYNGPTNNALTSKGIYVIFAGFTVGMEGVVQVADWEVPRPLLHSRICFTDN